MDRSGGCPQEALETGGDTAADCGLHLTHQTEDLAWPGTHKKKEEKTKNTAYHFDSVAIAVVKQTYTHLGQALQSGCLQVESKARHCPTWSILGRVLLQFGVNTTQTTETGLARHGHID